MKHSTAKVAMLVCSVGALGFLMMGMAFLESETMLYILGGAGVAMMVASYVIQMLFWKCPHCGKELPTRGFWKLASCPRCRTPL